MVHSIPLPSDFRDHGIDYLNLGWGTILQVLLDFADAEEWTGGVEPEMKEDFWVAAERELATALSLVEQGAEFLLKAKICEVSPWLLISRFPSDWPRRCDKEDIDFADFRTIDAQDLIKVHDTFAPVRLPPEFAGVFEQLRRERNSIMHTVNKNLRVAATPLIERILVLSEYLIGIQFWTSCRRKFIQRDRHAAIDYDYNEYRVAREFLTVIGLLGDTQLKRFFGFSRRRRSYACPTCSHCHKHVELECRSALLRPNTPVSNKIYCFICGTETSVERRDCGHDDCRGNVYEPKRNECLTCMKHPD